MSESQEVIAGYFPVIHAGYLELLDTNPAADVALLANDVLQPRFNYLRKDIRAMSTEQAAQIITGLNRTVRIIGEKCLAATMHTPSLVMPDDDISHALATEFSVTPKFSPVFLRWDRENSIVNAVIEPDRTVAISGDDEIIRTLIDHKNKSTNWWRHVSAAIIKDGQLVIATHNTSVPTPYSSAIDSDPRITAKRGVAIETSIDIHAEARAIAELAKQGVATEGTSIVVTTFPCPNCAKLIAESGIRSCYFIEGYAMLDGQSILKANSIEIVKIITEIPEEDKARLKPYPPS